MDPQSAQKVTDADSAATTLAQVLMRDGTLPVAEVVSLGRQILLDLTAIHARGVHHGRVNPENIQRRDGRWRLGDDLDEAGDGTSAYDPPEGLRDRHGDLFSVGAVLFVMATGETPDLIGDFMNAALPIPGQDPACGPLTRTIRHACAADPSNRFGSPQEMSKALEPASPPSGRRRAVMTAGTLVVAGVIALAALLAWNRGTDIVHGGGDSLHVVSMQLPHYRGAGRQARRIGDIGLTTWEARYPEDSVAVTVELSDPAYCYVIALNPDGSTRLCFPVNERTAPPRRRRLECPLGSGGNPVKFGFRDGVGAQAFVIVASHDPLPAYHTWRLALGELPWRPARTDGVWRFDGASLALEGTPGAAGGRPEALAPFTATLLALREVEGVDMVEGIIFAVR